MELPHLFHGELVLLDLLEIGAEVNLGGLFLLQLVEFAFGL